MTTDHYGRQIPKHAHGTVNLDRQTSSGERITEAVTGLYDRIVDRDLLVRRITITAGRVVDERNIETKEVFEQMDLFYGLRLQGEGGPGGGAAAEAGTQDAGGCSGYPEEIWQKRRSERNEPGRRRYGA